MIDDLITQEEVDAALIKLKEGMSKYSDDGTSLGHTMHMMYSHTFEFIKSNFKRYKGDTSEQSKEKEQN